MGHIFYGPFFCLQIEKSMTKNRQLRRIFQRLNTANFDLDVKLMIMINVVCCVLL